jgi:hypothetical protein
LEGWYYGFQTGRGLAENIRSFEEQADEWGGLKPLVGAAKVPKVSRIKKRLVDAAVNIRADEG